MVAVVAVVAVVIVFFLFLLFSFFLFVYCFLVIVVLFCLFRYHKFLYIYKFSSLLLYFRFFLLFFVPPKCSARSCYSLVSSYYYIFFGFCLILTKKEPNKHKSTLQRVNSNGTPKKPQDTQILVMPRKKNDF